MRELIEHGTIRWGSIGGGVRWVALNRRTARAYGYGDIAGLLVYQMMRESSLYREGVRPGDVVTRFSGQPVLTEEDLNRLVIQAKVGSRAPLEVVREGRRLTINVPIVERQSRGPQG
jgi:serine protease Do